MSKRSSPFWAFNSCVDVEAIVLSHENPDRFPVANRLVNYLGVKIDPEFAPHVLEGRDGDVEPPPVPTNWHADLSEWAGALRAVDLAVDTFRVVELGCGWGCWLLNTGVAARAKGLMIDLIGFEVDFSRAEWARRACIENGFSEDQFRILNATMGNRRGLGFYPRSVGAGSIETSGYIVNVSEIDADAARQSGLYDEVPVVRLGDLIDGNEKIDLLHVDVQGLEADLLESCIEDISRYVSYVVVGTHSRQIEGRIFSIFLKAGWLLEIERPAMLSLGDPKPAVVVDGVQCWRNVRQV